MFYTILKEFVDIFNQPLRLLIATNNFQQSDYLVVQRATETRMGEPTWIDIFTWPAPSNSIIDPNSFTNILIQLLKSAGVEFPGQAFVNAKE